MLLKEDRISAQQKVLYVVAMPIDTMKLTLLLLYSIFFVSCNENAKTQNREMQKPDKESYATQLIFFSSIRRHTRCLSDWSSDVCSSDLFDRLGKAPEELLEDSEAIAYLEPDPRTPPEPRKKSRVHTLRFPIQDHKLRPGPTVHDPATGDRKSVV